MMIAFATDLDLDFWETVEDSADAFSGRGHSTIVRRTTRRCLRTCESGNMTTQPPVRGVIPYVFCADAGAAADWCVEVLGFVERERRPDDNGVVRNVELVVGASEVWLDGPVPDWHEKTGGLGSRVGVLVDDVDAVHDWLVAAGIELDPPHTRDHWRFDSCGCSVSGLPLLVVAGGVGLARLERLF